MLLLLSISNFQFPISSLAPCSFLYRENPAQSFSHKRAGVGLGLCSFKSLLARADSQMFPVTDIPSSHPRGASVHWEAGLNKGSSLKGQEGPCHHFWGSTPACPQLACGIQKEFFPISLPGRGGKNPQPLVLCCCLYWMG